MEVKKDISYVVYIFLMIFVFTISSAFGQNISDTIQYVVHIKTDSYPSETKWTLYKDVYQGDTIAYVPYGHYTNSNTMHQDTLYVSDSITNISWVINDQYGDGITNGGSPSQGIIFDNDSSKYFVFLGQVTNATGSFGGEFYEMLIYNRDLAQSEYEEIETNLKAKHNIS